jgi:hypothetical protein
VPGTNVPRVSFLDSWVRLRGSRVGLMGLGQASVARVSSKTADLAVQDRHLGSSKVDLHGSRISFYGSRLSSMDPE